MTRDTLLMMEMRVFGHILKSNETVELVIYWCKCDKMSDCVLGTDYRADQEAAYGTPYAASVTDIADPDMYPHLYLRCVGVAYESEASI